MASSPTNMIPIPDNASIIAHKFAIFCALWRGHLTNRTISTSYNLGPNAPPVRVIGPGYRLCGQLLGGQIAGVAAYALRLWMVSKWRL